MDSPTYDRFWACAFAGPWWLASAAAPDFDPAAALSHIFPSAIRMRMLPTFLLAFSDCKGLLNVACPFSGADELL